MSPRYVREGLSENLDQPPPQSCRPENDAGALVAISGLPLGVAQHSHMLDALGNIHKRSCHANVRETEWKQMLSGTFFLFVGEQKNAKIHPYKKQPRVTQECRPVGSTT